MVRNVESAYTDDQVRLLQIRLLTATSLLMKFIKYLDKPVEKLTQKDNPFVETYHFLQDIKSQNRFGDPPLASKPLAVPEKVLVYRNKSTRMWIGKIGTKQICQGHTRKQVVERMKKVSNK